MDNTQNNTLDAFIQVIADFDIVPILPMHPLKRCHILIPDSPKPIGAIFHNESYYSYVMSYKEEDAAQRGAQRLLKKGNKVLLTTTRRGLILWVAESEAKRVWSS